MASWTEVEKPAMRFLQKFRVKEVRAEGMKEMRGGKDISEKESMKQWANVYYLKVQDLLCYQSYILPKLIMNNECSRGFLVLKTIRDWANFIYVYIYLCVHTRTHLVSLVQRKSVTLQGVWFFFLLPFHTNVFLCYGKLPIEGYTHTYNSCLISILV